jgi:hypothetical protein
MPFRRKRAAHTEMITMPKSEYLALCDRASSESARRVLGDMSAPTVAQGGSQRSAGLSNEQIELLLEEHYRQVLSCPEGRKMWRRLLGDVNAAMRLGID